MTFMKDILAVGLLGLYTQNNELDLCNNQTMLVLLLLILGLNHHIEERECELEREKMQFYHYNERLHDCERDHRRRNLFFDDRRRFDGDRRADCDRCRHSTPFAGLFPGQF